MDGRSNKNYNIALSPSKVTTISIYPYLGHLKSTFSSSPVLYPVYQRLFMRGFLLRYSFTLRPKTYRLVTDPEASPLHSIAAHEQKNPLVPRILTLS